MECVRRLNAASLQWISISARSKFLWYAHGAAAERGCVDPLMQSFAYRFVDLQGMQLKSALHLHACFMQV